MPDINPYTIYILAALCLWLIPLTIAIIWILIFFKKLSTVSGGEKESLTKVLNRLLDTQGKNTKNIGDIQKIIKSLKSDAKTHSQKVGLVKFNPFAEMGGDHSFSLAVLDGNDSGFILTALHTRDRTRMYIKEVRSGKSKIELSEHEKKAIETAKK